MQQLVDIRSRMSTVDTIGSVCGTLATVASAKLSRARERALATRVYTEAVRQVVGRQLIAAHEQGVEPSDISPLFAERPVARVLLLVVGTDQGLCGGYNLELDATARDFVSERTEAGQEVRLLVKGERTLRIMRRQSGVAAVNAGGWPKAGVTEEGVDIVFDATLQAFTNGEADEVWVCYAAFLSTVERKFQTLRLLPIKEPVLETHDVMRYFYEPSRDAPLQELLALLARLQVEDAMLEAFASEQAARMVTMQEATERADKTLADLRIRYNRVRREGIMADLMGVVVSRHLRSERENVTA